MSTTAESSKSKSVSNKNVLPAVSELNSLVTAHSSDRERVTSDNEHRYGQKMKAAYDKFLAECMSEDLTQKITEAAKRGQKRINLLVFDLRDRVHDDISYCSLLQGTHKTGIKRALQSHWVYEYKKSAAYKPVLVELAKRLGITEDSEYTLRCYKFGQIRWAVELEWVEDPEHKEKLAVYKQRFGDPW